MSQVIICIYDKANNLSDSITVNSTIEMVTGAITASDASVRVSSLGNILSLHVDQDNATTMAYAARLRNILTGESVERIVGAWCSLTGTAEANWQVARVNTSGLTVNLNTLGGWSVFNVADTRNNSEMANLKQWILEKSGLMADQRNDSTRAIHPSHVKAAGLNFLGFVTTLSELEHTWPVEAFRPGSAWMDSTHLYVCVKEGEKLRSYLRSEVGAPERVKALIADVPPMPEKAKEATRWMDVDTWAHDARAQGIDVALLRGQLNALTYLDNDPVDPCRPENGLVATSQVVIEADPTRHGGYNVWLGGEGYPVTGHGGFASAQLLTIDAQFNTSLELHNVPTELFHCIYSFDEDQGVSYARQHLGHRVILVVTPGRLIFVDSIDTLSIDRQVCVPEELYTALLTRYPMLAGSIAASTFSKLYPVLQEYSITTSGPMQEALVIRDTTAERGEAFHIADWYKICEYAQMLTDAKMPQRGHNPVFTTVDELGVLPDAPADQLEQARAMVKETTDKVTNALDGLRSRRGAQADPVLELPTGPSAAITVPVVDGDGHLLYNMNFIFDNEMARDAAVDMGFASQLATQLGQANFRGQYVMGPRIAELGALAQDLFLSMGLAGTFGYQRS